MDSFPSLQDQLPTMYWLYDYHSNTIYALELHITTHDGKQRIPTTANYGLGCNQLPTYLSKV